MKTRFTLALALIWVVAACSSSDGASASRHGRTTAGRPAVVARPNFDIYIYRRCYTPDEKPAVRLSAYNEGSIRFSIYRLDLPKQVVNSAVMEQFGKTLKTLNLSGLSQVRSFVHRYKSPYPDQWSDDPVSVPKLPSGAYLISASDGTTVRNTWLAITSATLLVKHSRSQLAIFAANALTGKPVPNLRLSGVDRNGKHWDCITDASGEAARDCAGAVGAIWLYGEYEGSPLFAITAGPPSPPVATVFTYTDRPIYRPGQEVHFKGIIRQRVDGEGPGGFLYKSYGDKALTLEVRDPTDALIQRSQIITNRSGSFASNIQLASAPSLGSWQIVIKALGQRYYGSFDVEEYHKPEFTASVAFDKSYYLGGDSIPVTIGAQYFFGQPVTGARVQYQVSVDSNGDVPDNAGSPEPGYSGNGVTDSSGKLTIEVKSMRLPFDRTINVNATVIDLSRKQQQASSSAIITAGLYQLSVSPEKDVYKPGETATIDVTTTDYDDKPVQAEADVTLTETNYDSKHRPYVEKTTRTVHTNAKGEGSAQFVVLRPGDLQVEAKSFDSRDDKIQAASDLWVAGDDEDEADYPQLDLKPDKERYKPGDTANVLINTSLVAPTGKRPALGPLDRGSKIPAANARPKETWALVTVAGEKIYYSNVVHLTSRSTVIKVPISRLEYPSCSLDVAVIQDRQLVDQDTQLEVADPEKELHVSVTPDKPQYQPGEPASYTVTTRNYKGEPVAAEVGLGVVDASIYAVEPDGTPGMESVFYPDQEVRVQTDYSFSAMYSGGAYQIMARDSPVVMMGGIGGPGGAPKAPAIRLRKVFADTAYWQPFVVTDAGGTGTASFTMPDNLTSWRATARGISDETQVGQGTSDVVSTLPLLVRLELPSFYVHGDQTTVSAIVNNRTSVQQSVHVELQQTGLAVSSGTLDQTISVDAGSQKRLDWAATVTGDDSATVTVVAYAGESAKDAVQTVVPVYHDGLQVVQARSAALADNDATYMIDPKSLPAGATVSITLAPSIAASLGDCLKWLESQPDGCTEEVVSSFLPDIVASLALKQLDGHVQSRAKLADWIGLGLQSIYRYQHSDGGWNWWEFDQTDGDMTAYVLTGLAAAKDAGFLVDDQRIARGASELKQMLDGEREASRRADWMLALALAVPGSVDKELGEMYQKKDELDLYGKASLCLALAHGQSTPNTMAADLAKDLESKIVAQGTSAHWTDEEHGYSWRDDDIEVTAHILRAVLAVDPKFSQSHSVVRWLMANRDGPWGWSCSRTSAEAVIALTAYLQTTGELGGTYDASISCDNTVLGKLDVTPASAFSAPTTVDIPAAMLSGSKPIVIKKTGPGVLYASVQIASTLGSDQSKPQSSGFTVRTHYTIASDDPSTANTVPTGADIDVTSDIESDSAVKYVVLEEPIPAGCEVQPEDDQVMPFGQVMPISFARSEVHDNRIVFYFDDLAKGLTTVKYRMHTQTPGSYRILPGIASLHYFPEVRGNTGLARTNIVDAP